MKIYRFETVSSTQDRAFELLESEDDFVVVWALRQTRGRGRQKHSWESEEGGLYVSFAFFGDFNTALRFNVSLSLCVLKVLRNLKLNAHLKIPNDILVNGRKIAGILVEINNNKIVAGLGLNVNQRSFKGSFDATSIFMETGKLHSLEDILMKLISCIESMKDLTDKRLMKLYEDEVVGRYVEFDYRGKNVKGRISAVKNWNLLISDNEYSLFHIYNVREL